MERVNLKENRVKLGNAELFYQLAGEGNTDFLLMLHGFTLTGDLWMPFADALSEKYSLIIPDMPLHGRSGGCTYEYIPKDYGDCILKLLNHLKIQKVKAIGHSMGAVTLLDLAIRRPEIFDAIVLVSGAHRINEEVRAVLLEDSFEASSDWFKEYYISIHPGGLDQIRAIFREENKFATKFPVVADKNYLFDISEIPIPVLQISGDRDSLFPIDIPVELFQTLTNSQLWVVPGQGHVPLWPEMGGSKEAANQFITFVDRFFTYQSLK